MAIFLMVPGAMHGKASFDLLGPALAAHGHSMVAPDLIGMDGTGRVHPRDVTLALWAEQIAALARAQPEPVILCGHSRGGLVISQAAEYAPEAIRTLVYIAALLVPDGGTGLDLLARLPATAHGTAAPSEDGTSMLGVPEVAMKIFYHRTPLALARHAANTLQPEPIRPVTEKLVLTEANYSRIPRFYIQCTDDQTVPLALQQEICAEIPCAVRTLDSDHSPFLCCPTQLAAMLVTLLGE